MKKKDQEKEEAPLTFDEAMKKILRTPKADVEKAIEKAKNEKKPRTIN